MSPAPAAPPSFANQFLIAMPGMADDTFAGSVVYLCEHTAHGALGLVINKPTDLALGGLFERVDLALDVPAWAEQPVYFGGPVQTERGFVLHDAHGGDGAFQSTLNVPGGLAMTTSKDVLQAICDGHGPRRALVTLGCSSWGAGQLERELAHNGWLTVDAEADVVFSQPIEQRYTRALGLLGVDPRRLSTAVGHA